MGFLKRFFRNVFREAGADGHQQLRAIERSRPGSSPRRRPRWQLHVDRRHPTVVRPASRTCGRDTATTCITMPTTAGSVPVLTAAVFARSCSKVFMELLDPLGSEVDVVLETSHNREATRPCGSVPRAYRHAGAQEHPVGVRRPAVERRLRRHRVLKSLRPPGSAVRRAQAADRVWRGPGRLRAVFGRARIPCDDQMKFITEAEHVHSSSDQFFRQFEELRSGLGMDSCAIRSQGASIAQPAAPSADALAPRSDGPGRIEILPRRAIAFSDRSLNRRRADLLPSASESTQAWSSRSTSSVSSKPDEMRCGNEPAKPGHGRRRRHSVANADKQPAQCDRAPDALQALGARHDQHRQRNRPAAPPRPGHRASRLISPDATNNSSWPTASGTGGSRGSSLASAD